MAQYILFYKPCQVLTQFSAEGGKKTLAAFFPAIAKNIYPVGRLDYDSEGLLLLTDDASLTHRLLDPSFAHPRTYWVQVEGEISAAALRQMAQGITINIDGKPYRTKKAVAQFIGPAPALPERNPPVRHRKNIPTSWLSLTLTEGKNRQVRRMTAAVGFPTLRLVRYAIGNVTIQGFSAGEHREMGEGMVQQLFRNFV